MYALPRFRLSVARISKLFFDSSRFLALGLSLFTSRPRSLIIILSTSVSNSNLLAYNSQCLPPLPLPPQFPPQFLLFPIQLHFRPSVPLTTHSPLLTFSHHVHSLTLHASLLPPSLVPSLLPLNPHLIPVPIQTLTRSYPPHPQTISDDPLNPSKQLRYPFKRQPQKSKWMISGRRRERTTRWRD